MVINLTLEDISKIKTFTKSFVDNDLKSFHLEITGNKLKFYISHARWYTNLEIALAVPAEQDVFLTCDLPVLSKAILKFNKGVNMDFDENKLKITCYGDNKKNRISLRYSIESDFVKREVQDRIQKFKNLKVQNPISLKFTEDTFAALEKIEKVNMASTVEFGTLKLTSKQIEFANSFFIYNNSHPLACPVLEKDDQPYNEHIYLNTSTIPTLKGAREFEVFKFDVADNYRFLYAQANGFEIISSQNKLRFEYPTPEELEFIAPQPKKGWWFKFDTKEILAAFEEFKNVFVENSYRWEPIQFSINRDTKELVLSYSDIKVEETRDFEPLEMSIDTFTDVCYNEFITSAQVLKLFLKDTQEAVLTFIPKEFKSTENGSKAVALSLNEYEVALVKKLV